MKKSILLIDGENFKYKIKEILKKGTLAGKGLSVHDFNVELLFNNLFKDKHLKEKNYYSAKLHFYKETAKKSNLLIKEQRKWKRKLESSGFNYIVSGHVRLQEVIDKFLGKKSYVFYEKGVDVRIAVDLVSFAYEKSASTVYLCSSDSDLQPAIRRAKEKGLNIVYVGFEESPNIGMTKTTNRTVLIRQSEILECFERFDPWNSKKI